MTEATVVKDIPEQSSTKPKPSPSRKKKEVPAPTEVNRELPKIEKEENCIKLGEVLCEIKPTKLKYFRNRTVSIYSALKLVP